MTKIGVGGFRMSKYSFWANDVVLANTFFLNSAYIKMTSF